MTELQMGNKRTSAWSPSSLRAASIITLFLASMAMVYYVSPNFFSSANLVKVLVQTVMLAILSIGMTFVMIGGGIDLSLPANMALAGILGSMVMVATGNVFLGCLVMLLAGTCIGALNGIAVAYLRMIPFVVTLATLSICGGLSVWITNSVSISNQPEEFYTVLLSKFMGVPTSILIMLAAVILGQAVMSMTPFGRHLYAVGTNAAAARISRVPVQRTLFASYGIAGFLAGVAAIVITARLGSASANVGNDSVILGVVTACVIGGVSIYGGVGRPIAVLFGAIFVLVMGNVLNLIGISFFIGLVIKGALIIGLVALDRAVGEIK